MRSPLSILLAGLFVFSTLNLWAQIPRTYPSDQAALSAEGVVTVNIDTHVDDDWEFSGNVNMGRATLRNKSRQPESQVFEVFEESGMRLQQAMQSLKAPEVPLTEFTADRLKDGLQINWTTQVEKGVKSFVLERSADQKKWEHVSDAQPSSKTQGLMAFQMNDLEISAGSNFYRIKKQKANGQWGMSNTIAVEVLPTSTHTTYLFPNPIIFGTTIELDLHQATRVTISLRNADHSLVARIYSRYTSIGRHVVELDMANLPQGDYLCEIKVGNDVAYREIRK